MQEQHGSAEAGTAVQERLCPKCESPMVRRTSKYGAFLGCSGYPKCTHIDKK